MQTRRMLLMVLVGVSLCAGYRVGYKDESIYQDLDTLAEVMTLVQAQSPDAPKGQDLVEGAIDGFLAHLDPHTSFYNSDHYQTMKEDQHGSFFGIGIIVGFQNEKLTVVSPMAGGPAHLAGIRAGDVIGQIDDQPSEDLSSDDAVRLLRGDKGTAVRLKILRSGLKEPLLITLTRAEIPSYDVRTSFMIDEETGYVALKEFGETAADEVAAATKHLKAMGMKQMILDLRGNPGGLLPQAINVAGLFLKPNSMVVYTQGRMAYASEKYYSSNQERFEDLPLIVLIDRGSASASEIVAGALQDQDRALVVGVTSWGKGLVQSVFPLSGGDTGLALTTSRYYTPSGRHIQGNFDVLEDYYNPKSAKEKFFDATAEDRSAFKTTHGRKVSQDRGITPDVYLSYEEEPELSISLETNNQFFNFATEHQEQAAPFTRDFEVSDAMLDTFKAWLVAKDQDVVGFEENRDFLRHKLTFQFFYIGSSRESEQWAWHYHMVADRHVKAALEVFPKAVELMKVYRGETSLRADYAAELKAFSRLREKDNKQSAALSVTDQTRRQ